MRIVGLCITVAIAVLPGAETARTWEPEPGRVYSWERAAV